MRVSDNEMQEGVIKNGYSYTHQVWIEQFVVQDCGHPQAMKCRCFGRQHAGEQVRFPS